MTRNFQRSSALFFMFELGLQRRCCQQRPSKICENARAKNGFYVKSLISSSRVIISKYISNFETPKKQAIPLPIFCTCRSSSVKLIIHNFRPSNSNSSCRSLHSVPYSPFFLFLSQDRSEDTVNRFGLGEIKLLPNSFCGSDKALIWPCPAVLEAQ